eukprot:UC1_evm1s1268
MPKKGKKAKKGSKKSKKSSSSSSSKDGTSVSDASSGPPKPHVPNVEEKIWAVRFNISEQARREHRDNAALLVKENGILQERMEDTERDTMEVVGFLRTQ